MNRKNLWFLTLFSLMLVLSVYYVTMPSELLLQTNVSDEKKSKVVVEESDVLVALRVDAEEERTTAMSDLKKVLMDAASTVEQKNTAYESLQALNITKGKEEALESMIKEQYKLGSFVKIKDDQVQIVIVSKKHDTTLANNIMRTVQSEFEEKMYISVKFQA